MGDALVVVEGGLFSTVQDEGRFGFARIGISASGAMDLLAMRVANALAGNPVDTAIVESTVRGPDLTVEAERCRLAFAGMEACLTLNGSPVAAHRSFDAVRGDRVAVLPGTAGLRGYLAVAGGFAIPPVLGSRSTHTRSRLGGIEGRALRPGDRLPLANAAAVAGPGLALEGNLAATGPVRVLLGPQDDLFSPEGIATFLGSEYRVTNNTDRMGCQLEGSAIAHRSGFNIVSDGIMNGSIQVPGHGRPIVLLADRQTTGGYPKIATVISADLRFFAQARPGAIVRFVAVTAAEAERIAAEEQRRTASILAAIAPLGPPPTVFTAERLLSLNLIGGVVDAVAD